MTNANLSLQSATDYLTSTDTIDWQHPTVLKQAGRLKAASILETAKHCYEFVRDEIRHSCDYRLNPVTCRASDVLAVKTGFCYAKSHLLAALLRANSIPAGLCYQRLIVNEFDGARSYCLHGLNAVFLPDIGWYRIDARGNKPSVDAQFAPPVERLAFTTTKPGEADMPGIWIDPLPEVVAALRTYDTYEQLAQHLPDVCSSRL